MDDFDFVSKAAGFLAQCSTEQRAQLVKMAEKFGKPDAVPGGAAMDARSDVDPFKGKSFEQMFPDSQRLLR